jgi:signal transduction histidine kinase
VDHADPSLELETHPLHDELDRAVGALAALERQRLHTATANARATVSTSIALLVGFAAIGLIAALSLAALLERTLRKLRREREVTLQHTKRVEELNIELNAFAGRVAHDLRNLLSPMDLAVSQLRRAANTPQRVAAIADRIARGTHRTLAVLDGLLAFSQSGRPALHASSSVGSVVNDVLEQLEPVAKRVDARIESRIDDATVECSRELLNVVILNLVGNAIKFLQGRETRQIWIDARPVADECEISVSDTGPGIAHDELERIFEPFYRAPGTVAPGMGIGLATVQRVVRAHGGRVSVESDYQRGTTFRVTFALADSATGAQSLESLRRQG